MLNSIEEYRELYRKEFLQEEIKTHDGVPVICREWNFDHMFFRNKESKDRSKRKFDKKTANSMLCIKDIINWDVVWVEVYEEVNIKKGRKERSHILICDGLYIILCFDKTRNVFYLVTAYHRSRWEIIKFKKAMAEYQIL